MRKIYLLIIFCVTVFVFSSFSRAEESNSLDTGFYFVQITDTHFRDKDSFERTGEIIEKINALSFKVEFVVLTGDIFFESIEDANMVNAAKAVFSKLKSPIHLVVGNHDINTDKAKSIYVSNFGQLNYIEKYHNVFCMFTCTEPLFDDSNSNDEEYFKWFENEMKAADGKPIIIFTHRPAGKDFYDNKFHQSWPIKAEKRWTELINSYNVKAVITGHFHRDEFCWLGNVPMFVCEPISSWLGRQAAFRVYQYKNGKVDYFSDYLEK